MTVKTRSKQHAAQQAAWLAQQRRRRWLIAAAWIAAGVIFVAVLGYLVWKDAQPAPRPGEDVPVLGRDHVQPGVPHDPYNSDPPTSGPHYPTTAEVGFYDEAPADEYLVHNLEHGNVVIWYNCSQLSPADCETLKGQIKTTMSQAGLSQVTGTSKLVAVPRPTMTTLLALTSWGRIDRLDKFDQKEILDFIKAFRDHAPENSAP
jgi:hypothetical protein